MKKIFLLCALMVMSVALFAAEPIKEGNMNSGYVIVKGSEENISFATVQISSCNDGDVPESIRITGTTANEEVQFDILRLSTGS